ncbi:oligosaccharide flippase family protein [Parvibaculum sp.]|uniref:oligosaccharide flippase family protein n=1 Tax=Parvibaculum sp. TaxID=2024848 RepID=UPI00391C7AB2
MAALRGQLVSTYAAEGVSLVSGLAFGVIAARVLGPEGRGLVAVIWTGITIGMMVSSLGIAKSLVSRLNDKAIDLEGSDYYGALILSLPFLSVLAWAVILPLMPALPVSERVSLCAMLVLLVPVMFATDVARSVLRARRRIYVLNAVAAVAAIVRISALVVMWSLDHITVAVVLMIEAAYWVFSGLVVGAALSNSIFSPPKFARALDAIKSLLSYGILFQLYSILFNFINKINVPIINHLSSPEAAGFFIVGARFAEYLGTFANQIVFVVLPFLAQKENKLDAIQYGQRLTRTSLVFMVPAALIMIVAADPVIALLYGVDFAPAATPLRFMTLAIVAATVFQFSGMAFIATGQVRGVTICSAVGFCCSVLLAFLLIPQFGATGAAASAAVGYLVSLSAHLLVMKLSFGYPIASSLVPRAHELRQMFLSLRS